MATTTSPLAALMGAQVGAIGGQPSPIQPSPIQPAAPTPEQLFQLHDKRKVFGATGVPMSNRYNKGGAYSPSFMTDIVKAAQHQGVDPNLALAVALQESNMKPDDLEGAIASSKEVGAKTPEGLNENAYQFAKILKAKMAEGKQLGFSDEARQIQMFNGMGKIFPRSKGMGDESYYGIKVSRDNPLDMRKNPVYGRVIQDLRDNVIKNNPDLQKFIAGIK